MIEQPRFLDCLRGDGAHEVDVSYSGGCTQHDFRVCWPDQSFQGSNPVQAALEMFHEANGDSCKAYLSTQVITALEPLRAAYEEGYGTRSGTIILKLGGKSTLFTF